MKKIIFAIALVLAIGLTSNAQQHSGKDGLFNDWEDVDNGLRDPLDPGELPGLPGNHGNGNDNPAPLGSGLVVLTALGAGYAVARRKREE